MVKHFPLVALLGVHAVLPGFCSVSSAASVVLNFDAASGMIFDGEGNGTGFSVRLPGTGESLPIEDSRLMLNAAAGVLEISTSEGVESFNGQEGVGDIEAIGIRLSSLGFTGMQDFMVEADFLPLPNVGPTDQAGIFVGSDSATLTRAGHNTFEQPERFSTNTLLDYDVDGHFFGTGLNGADGMTVVIERSQGEWHFSIDGVEWLPNVNPDGSGEAAPPTFLDDFVDLVVGVFAINSYDSTAATYLLDRFSVSVAGPSPSADFDGDGIVTSADLVNWNLGFGRSESAARIDGNANGDQFVDGADFLIWQGDFDGLQDSSLAQQAVPEPEGVALLLTAYLIASSRTIGSTFVRKTTQAPISSGV